MNKEQTITIDELHKLYMTGALTPGELIQSLIQQAEAYADKNIWIVKPDAAWIQPYVDGLGEMDLERKPLWGVPFAIKDNIDVAGLPTTAACPAFSYEATRSATAVERLVEAGAIPVGKTNLDQFATGLVGVRSPYGDVHNALRDELISGGSSSGSAVAVALGLAAFALGTDTAGSGRVPAALNHLIGFKPPCGSWSVRGLVPACASLDCITVMANTLTDIRLVDAIVRGYDPEDRWSRRIPEGRTPDDVGLLIPNKPLTFYGPYADAYQQAWEATIAAIRAGGISVEEADCSFYQEAAALLYGGPCVAERWADLGTFIQTHLDDVFPTTREVLLTGDRPDYTAASLYQVQHQLADYKRMARNQLQQHLLLLPTCGGTYTREEVRANGIETNTNMGTYTNHCNLLDLCAIDVPGVDAGEQLPFGMTLFAPYDGQQRLLQVAEEILALELS